MKHALWLGMAGWLLTAGLAQADPIDGNWRTTYGQAAAISGGVITLKTGRYAGKRIGQLMATGGGNYSGTILDPSSGRSYSGTAKLDGASLHMTGCIVKMICRTRTWQRL